MEQNFILKIHFAATFYMLGIILIIQMIHYPLFAQVGRDNFPFYHSEHIRLTSIVIAFPMLVELFSLVALYYLVPVYRTSTLFNVSAFLLLVIWLVTFFISVPQHNILSKGFNQEAWSVLVNTNWIRTIAWFLRAAIVFKFI